MREGEKVVDIETIIKAYKFCKNDEGTCDECSYFPKKSKLYGCPINNDTISAISEQKAEIDRLKAEQPKHGHWIEQEGFDGDVYYDCSVCGESWVLIDGTPKDNGMIYCPHCGARMDGE